MSNSLGARLSPGRRREQILNVARTHFARDGFDGTSVCGVAGDAGVTRALVYHYFPGKDALLEAVLRREAAALLQATAPDPRASDRENIHRALEAYLDHFAASQGDLRGLYAPRATTPSVAREIAAANHVVQVDRLLRFTGQSDSPSNRLAFSAWLALVEEAARTAADTPAVPRTDVVRLCLRALEATTGVHLDGDPTDRPDPAAGAGDG